MLTSLIGTKVGMARVFDATGNLIPVTVIAAGPCTVTEIRTLDRDGYSAIQLGLHALSAADQKRLSRPLAGQFKKRSLEPKKHLHEVRVDSVDGFQVGQEIKVDMFKEGDFVDIQGTTKGHGFAGGVKRHGFAGGPTTHGQSDRQRAPGSIGSQGPQRVMRGMRMAGHLGSDAVTIQCMKIVRVDADKNLLLVRGAVPGVKTVLLVISKTVKKIAIPAKTAADAKKKPAAAKKK